DPDAALIWLIRAAEQGDLIAAYNLGRMYSKGPEAMQDLSTAAKWYHVAADHDHPAAMQDLAMLYATGRGVEKDISLAAQLTQQSQELECMVGDPAKNFNPRVKRMAVAN
ncbi:MAG TPA: tetratricopeptide repeat protein, partial [Paracoccaceae bacterium]|nr:tetratricopeptide repeat protein [Paracoccaceae bacterium]